MDPCPHCLAKIAAWEKILESLHGDLPNYRFLRSRITGALSWWASHSVQDHNHPLQRESP